MFDEVLIDVALQTITDLANHAKVGKALGERHVSGDLTGCLRIRFDVPGIRPERFRVIYRLAPNDTIPDTIEVISVGPRGGHAAYRVAAYRLGADWPESG